MRKVYRQCFGAHAMGGERAQIVAHAANVHAAGPPGQVANAEPKLLQFPGLAALRVHNSILHAFIYSTSGRPGQNI